MKKSYSVVSAGYNRFVFKTHDKAIEFYKILSAAIPVGNCYGALPDGRKDISYIVEKDVSISIERIDASAMELEFTREELQEKEKKKDDIQECVSIISGEDDPREIRFDGNAIRRVLIEQ